MYLCGLCVKYIVVLYVLSMCCLFMCVFKVSVCFDVIFCVVLYGVRGLLCCVCVCGVFKRVCISRFMVLCCMVCCLCGVVCVVFICLCGLCDL